jgi:hypothetical protein
VRIITKLSFFLTHVLERPDLREHNLAVTQFGFRHMQFWKAWHENYILMVYYILFGNRSGNLVPRACPFAG